MNSVPPTTEPKPGALSRDCRGGWFKGEASTGVVALFIFLMIGVVRCSSLGQGLPLPLPPSATPAPTERPTQPPLAQSQPTSTAGVRPTEAETSPAAILGPAPVTDTTFRHDPFATEECGACHDLQNQQNPKALWSSSIVEVCRLCHWQELDAPQPSIIHDPFPQGECLSCHDPHASGEAFLLKAAQGELCRECHAIPQRQSHPSIAVEECLLCHAGHGSEQPAILREPQVKLCARCHADHTQENVAFVPHIEAAQDCAQCHDPHTGELARQVISDGCRECHADVFTAEPAVSHRPVEAGRCLECHNFHQKEQFALLKASQPELCSECHEVGVPAAELPPPYPPQPSPAPDAGGDRGGAS